MGQQRRRGGGDGPSTTKKLKNDLRENVQRNGQSLNITGVAMEKPNKQRQRKMKMKSINHKEEKHGKIKKQYKISKLGTWNIRSLNGKEIEIINEFERAGLEILVIPETKKKGNGILELENDHLLVWSGVEDTKRAQAGIGCILHRDIKEKLNKWEAISERILSVELKYKTHVKTIIAVYGPNEDKRIEEKDKFWEDLSVTVGAAKGIIFVAGDINGRVGKGDHTYTTIGKHGEDERNNNGKRLLDFCTIHDLIVTNTFYEHKDIHKYTRVEPSRGEQSIIDYILVERENRTIIRDVAVKRGYEISSDHYLLIAEIKEKEEKENMRYGQNENKIDAETIKSYKLKNKETAAKYEERVNKGLENGPDRTENNSIEEKWKLFKNTVIQAAKDICGTSKVNKNKKQTAWWTDEIKQQVKDKKKKWQQYLSNKNERNYESYKEQRIKVKNIVLESKQKTWKEFGDMLEKDSKSNQKLFYRVLKNFRNKKKVNFLTIKNKDGEIITNETKVMERWKEYFQQLLETRHENQEQELDDEEPEEKEIIKETEGENIKKEELKEAIKEMKNGKAPGYDKITAEMIKNMGERGTQKLLEIFNKVWEEEKIPKDWEIGLIVPIYKKGDNKDCNNYRGITLLSTIMKLFEKIMEKRLRKEIEPKLTEAQSGFRKGRSTQDHVFTIKEIIKRTLSRAKTVYLAFMDMEKAFDRVPRTKIWECLNKKGVGKKLVRVIKCLYKETRNSVISKNSNSEVFTSKEGVRQGGSLSPLLFITFMDELIRETEQRTKTVHIGYRNMERIEISECAFADDIAIIAGNEKDLKEKLNVWNEVLKNNGMKMNKSKTKVMVVSGEKKEIEVILDGEVIEQVSNFQYLGVTLEETGKQEVDIRTRIEKANKVYHALSKGITNKKELTKQTKMKVYKAICRPILTYGCESWVLTQQDKSKIRATEMKYLRRVKGVTKLDRIRSDQIRKELNIESVEKFIEKRQMGWWGHLQRLKKTTQVKRIWEAKTTGKKKRGRPALMWNDALGRILKRKGKTWAEAKKLAENRQEWNKFIRTDRE